MSRDRNVLSRRAERWRLTLDGTAQGEADRIGRGPLRRGAQEGKNYFFGLLAMIWSLILL